MPIADGTRLGPYQITAAIGAGGMGEVYRARDTRLNRDVAIKVLPPAFAADPGRLARFEREAQTLATLNHPHIAHIHGVIGPPDAALHALVMEFVDGEDLAERLRRGPIPLEEALAIARQIADALDAAHERGVIHRDLKPANIKLTPDGTVKVLDFGLAKALTTAESSPLDPAQSPTFTSPAMTGLGVVLGTAAYMAPEQAKGKPVDRRADIWACGVVLYEMLTGRLLYAGETVTETIAQVITQPASLDALPARTPAGVRRILRRCLDKDPRNRFQSAGDVRIEIEELLAGRSESAPPPAAARRAAWMWVPAALILGAVAVGLLVGRPWQRGKADAPSMVLDVRIDESVRLHLDENVDGALAVISPDGQSIAYLGMRDTIRRLYVRRLDATASVPLSGTENALSHFFSPDGQWIGFFSNGTLKKVRVTGGAPLSLAQAVDPRGGAWGANGDIVFTPTTTSALHRVSAAGDGKAEPMTTLGARERTHRWPSFLPDGRTVVFMVQEQDASYDDGTIEAVNLETKSRKVLIRGGTFPRYLEPGRLTFVREHTVFAVPFDAGALELKGNAEPLLSQVMQSRGLGAGTGNGGAQVSFSNNGTAVVLTGQGAETRSQLLIATRDGKPVTAAPDRRQYRSPSLSPDGSRVAVEVAEGVANHVHVFDIARGALSKITFDGTVNGGPIWSNDGRRLGFFSDRSGVSLNIVTTRSDGGGETEALTSNSFVNVPMSFSPDGAWLAMMEQGRDASGGARMDIMVLSLRDKKTTPFLATPASEMMPVFSPDGRWIAYQSDESGIVEVYVRPFPGPGGKWQVSLGGGGKPAWTKGGKEIVYAGGAALNEFFAVEITASGDTIVAGKPARLFSMPVTHPPNAWWHDVSRDGERFVLLKADESQGGAEGETHFRLITNVNSRVR